MDLFALSSAEVIHVSCNSTDKKGAWKHTYKQKHKVAAALV